MVNDWFDLELVESLDEIAETMCQFDPVNMIIVKEMKKSVLKAYGEVIFRLLFPNVEHWKDLSEDQLMKIGKALIKSGNLEKIHHFLYFFHDMPKIPKELLRELEEKIIFSYELGAYHWTRELLQDIPNLPPDLIKVGMARVTHDFRSHWSKKDQKLIQVLDFIIGYWLVHRSHPVFAIGRSGIPSFNWTHWELIDEDSSGVLISCLSLYHTGNEEERRVKVALLPDVTKQGPGYAVEVPRELNTVHEARAWMFRQDPEKWKGFDKEV